MVNSVTFNDTTYDDVLDNEVSNTSWVANCFLLNKDSIDSLDLERRSYSSADRKFGDTSFGGGPVLNMPPAFCRFADIPTGYGLGDSRNTSSDGDFGSGYGPCFSEAIVDNLDVIHIKAGMAEYNALTNFYAYFYNVAAGDLANRGDVSTFGSIIGTVAGFLVAAPLVAYVKLGRFIRWVQDKPYSAYYYLSPTMTLYWQTLEQAVNLYMVKAGYMPMAESNQWVDGRPDTRPLEMSQAEVDQYNYLLPDIFRSQTGGINISAVATRYKRLERSYRDKIKRMQEEGANTYDDLIDNIRGINPNTLDTAGYIGTTDMVKGYTATSLGQGYHSDVIVDSIAEASGATTATTSSTPDSGGPTVEETNDSLGGYENDFLSHFNATVLAGLDYVSFAVNYIGETSISISNSAGESPVASTINGIVASSRSAKSTIAYGNIGDNVIANFAEGVVGEAKSAMSSFADTVGMSFISAMSGNGFVDIPNIWQDSSVEMPTHTYTIELEATTAHPISKLQDIVIPALALMTLATPLSTGNKSYTSPFLIELHHQGKNKIELGMVSNLTIQFGNGEPGDWDFLEKSNRATATFSVVNLSNKLHIPMAADASGFMNDATNFTDWLDIMSSLSLHDQDSTLARMKRKGTFLLTNMEKWTSPSSWGMAAGGIIKSSFINNFLPATTKQ